MRETIIIEWAPEDACRLRYVFEPQKGGTWLRTEKSRRNGTWQVITREVVTEVRLECPPTDPHGDSGIDTYRGP